MKDSLARFQKDMTTIHVLDILDPRKADQQKRNQELAIERLSTIAKYYKVPMKKSNLAPPLNSALRKFIINKEGFIQTIPQLYNSINSI